MSRIANTAVIVAGVMLCSVGCVHAAGDEKAQEPRMQLTEVSTHVLDFSQAQGGGVAAGSFDNFAFTLDPARNERKFSLRGDEHLREVIASYDFAECRNGQQALLARTVAKLPPGHPAWVDYVDIEMIPYKQTDFAWKGGVCFGYRAAGGEWQWNLAAVPLVYDAASDRVRARVWVKEGGIDAIKLVFESSVPRQHVSRVVVGTLPEVAEAVDVK